MMSRNRLLIIGAVVFTLLIVALGIVGLFSSSKSSTSSSTATQTTPAATPVSLTIESFAKDTGIYTASVQKSIESALLAKISSTTSLTGHVRSGSLIVTATGTAKNTRFIVDFPDIKRSYVASLGEDSSTGEASLYILCPAANELIYPSFNCVDSAA
jgi:hypothetical protein